MLKRISVDQLRLGMHLHEVCGPWLDHPFWTQRFVVRDPQDLARLRSSGAAECLIDTAKGVDVLTTAPASAPPPRSMPTHASHVGCVAGSTPTAFRFRFLPADR